MEKKRPCTINTWRHRTCKPLARLFVLVGLRPCVLKFRLWALYPLAATVDDQLYPLLPTLFNAPLALLR